MVSIIVPAYNAEKSIYSCLLSILAQKTDEELEILVIDDGSTDNTGNIVRDLAKKNSLGKIKYFYKENAGVSAARNWGISRSKGNYIVFVDADDTIEDAYLAKMLSYTKEFDLVVSAYHIIELEGKERNVFFPVDEMNFKQYNEYFNELYPLYFFNSVCNKLYQRDFIINYFDEKMKIGEDLVFNLSYLQNVKKIKIINEALYNYFCCDMESATKKYNEEAIKDCILNAFCLKQFCEKYNIDQMSSIDEVLLYNISYSLRALVYFNKKNRQYLHSEFIKNKKLINEYQIGNLYKSANGSFFDKVIFVLAVHGGFDIYVLWIKLSMFLKSIKK